VWTRCAGAATIAILVGCAEGVAGAAPSDRLAWTQEGVRPDLRFKILVDDESSMLTGASCVSGSASSECSASLPPMRPGVHRVAVTVVDPSGTESTPSEWLTVIVDGSGAVESILAAAPGHAPASSNAPADAGSRSNSLPSRACAGQECYGVSVLARGQGVITRIEALSDGGVLMVRDGRDVLLVRSGAVATAYRLREDDPTASAIADLAVDPDFANNRFVYLAIVSGSSASSRVRIVRVRELADRLAEAATIVSDLQIAGDVMPRLSIAADRHLYLAIPAAPVGVRRQSYDGLILAFTDDGRSAGGAAGSPVLARGPQQPATLQPSPGWMWAASLDDGGDGRLRLLKLSADGVLTMTREIESGSARDGTGVLDLAFTRPDRGLLIGASPQSLFAFRLSTDAAVLSTERIDLGAFEPTALSTMSAGSIVVAVRDATDPATVVILSLSPLTDARR
jgi:hypothetical protein